MKVLLLLLPLLAMAAADTQTEEYSYDDYTAGDDMAGRDTAGHDMSEHDTAGHDRFEHDVADHDTHEHDTADHDMAEPDQKAAQPRTAGEPVDQAPLEAKKVNSTLTCYCEDLHGPMLECAYSKDDRDLWSCYKVEHGEGQNTTVMKGYIQREKCEDDDWLDQKLSILNVRSSEYQPRMYCCHDKDLCNGGVTTAASWLLMPLAGVLLLTAY